MLGELVESALSIIFGTANEENFTSASKVPYFNNVSNLGFMPKGLVSLSKMQQVLGEVACTTSATDPDSITSCGFYQHGDWDTSKAPAANGILIVPFFDNEFWKFQLFVQRSPVDALYYRTGTSTGYSGWHKLAEG